MFCSLCTSSWISQHHRCYSTLRQSTIPQMIPQMIPQTISYNGVRSWRRTALLGRLAGILPLCLFITVSGLCTCSILLSVVEFSQTLDYIVGERGIVIALIGYSNCTFPGQIARMIPLISDYKLYNCMCDNCMRTMYVLNAAFYHWILFNILLYH